MNSKSKYNLDSSTIRRLFEAAGIDGVRSVAPLGNGEFSAVYAVDTASRAYVLKVSPLGSEHCMTYEQRMLASEVLWYSRIREHTQIRVPEVYWFDDSQIRLPAAYCILERLPGEPLPTASLSQTERAEIPARLAEMLACIHGISGMKFGYEQCALRESWPEALRDFVVQALADCARKHRRSRRGERLLHFIERYRTILEPVSPCMVNFDLWPSNVIARRERGELTLAWIDPERSFWGDPAVDFVCLAFSRPLSSAAKAIAAYNKASSEPIEPTHNTQIRYAFGQGYLALIMETEKYFRYSPLRFGWWRNVLAANLLYRAAFRTLEEKRANK